MFSFSETIREISDYKKFIVSDNKYFTASTFYNYKEQFYMQELSIYTGWGRPCWEGHGGKVDERLDMKAQKTKCVLGCMQSSVGSRVREEILPLCTPQMRLHLEQCPVLGFPAQRGHGPFGVSPESHGDGQRAEPPLLWRKAWKSWGCSAWKPHCNPPLPRGGL